VPIATLPIAAFPIASVPLDSDVAAPPAVVTPAACFGYTTAGDAARRALRLILVEGADSSMEPDEYADALDMMNGYMLGLEAQGVRLGYTRVCNVSDIVTIPEGAMRGMIANLAIDMAPMYGGKITAALIKQAGEGEKTLLRLGVHVGSSRYPDSLPMGVANSCWGDAYSVSAPFALISMASNRIPTVMPSRLALMRAQGVWSVGEFSGYLPDIGGRISNVTGTRTATITAELTLVAAADIIEAEIAFARNQTVVLATHTALSTDPTTVTLTGSVTMMPGQYLELVLADIYTETSITLTNATVRIT